MNITYQIRQMNHASRAKDWRLSFIPFIIACVYLWLFYFDISLSISSILLFFLSLTTSFGFAALGYLLNEFFDKQTDFLAGKINKLASLPISFQLSIFSIAISLTFLPWIYLPSNFFSWILISSEILCFIVYSFPGIRFKDIPVLSNVIDTLYAYVLPLVLAFHTYNLFSENHYNDSLIVLFVLPVFFVGFRNIFIHQINDVFKDSKSGVYNLPVILGVENSRYLILTTSLLELVSWTAFSIFLMLKQPLSIIWFLFYLFHTAYLVYTNRKSFNSVYLPIKPVRHLNDKLYQIWFPLITFLLLVIIDWRWLVLLPLHITLLIPKEFFIPVKLVVKNIFHAFVKIITVDLRKLVSLSVNYPIYILFLSFGVNLQKEKKSALQYIKDKLF